jgi:hypothetical protein
MTAFLRRILVRAMYGLHLDHLWVRGQGDRVRRTSQSKAGAGECMDGGQSSVLGAKHVSHHTTPIEGRNAALESCTALHGHERLRICSRLAANGRKGRGVFPGSQRGVDCRIALDIGSSEEASWGASLGATEGDGEGGRRDEEGEDGEEEGELEDKHGRLAASVMGYGVWWGLGWKERVPVLGF